MAPATLRLPEPLLNVLPPRPAGFPATRELFERHTGLTFDALAPAEAAAGLTFALLFHPERASRLVQQQARDPQLPGLNDLITRALDATWKQPAKADYDGEIQRAVNYVALSKLFALAANGDAAPQVQAVVTLKLAGLREWLATSGPRPTTAAQQAHFDFGARLIGQFFDHPKEFAPPPVPATPPGQPIGDDFDR